MLCCFDWCMTTRRQPGIPGYRLIEDSDGRRAGLLLADKQTGEEWTARLVKYSADIRSSTEVVDLSARNSQGDGMSSRSRLVLDARGRIWRLQRHGGRVPGRRLRPGRDPKASRLKSQRALTAVTFAGCLVCAAALAIAPRTTLAAEPANPASEHLPTNSTEAISQPVATSKPRKMLVFGGVGVTLLGDPNQTPAIEHTKLPVG